MQYPYNFQGEKGKRETVEKASAKCFCELDAQVWFKCFIV
jgi:hypothetical protein